MAANDRPVRIGTRGSRGALPVGGTFGSGFIRVIVSLLLHMAGATAMCTGPADRCSPASGIPIATDQSGKS